MKICTKCNVEKEKTQFNKDAKNKDGLRRRCKECDAPKRYSLNCFYCKKQFVGPKRKQFCSKECRYATQSEQQKFLYDLNGAKGIWWHGKV